MRGWMDAQKKVTANYLNWHKHRLNMCWSERATGKVLFFCLLSNYQVWEQSPCFTFCCLCIWMCFTSPSDNWNELDHPALCGAEASHVVHMWTLEAAPLAQTVSGAAGNQSWSNRSFALWNCESSYTKPRGDGSTTGWLCPHPLHFLKLQFLGT